MPQVVCSSVKTTSITIRRYCIFTARPPWPVCKFATGLVFESFLATFFAVFSNFRNFIKYFWAKTRNPNSKQIYCAEIFDFIEPFPTNLPRAAQVVKSALSAQNLVQSIQEPNPDLR